MTDDGYHKNACERFQWRVVQQPVYYPARLCSLMMHNGQKLTHDFVVVVVVVVNAAIMVPPHVSNPMLLLVLVLPDR
jgi:hypothetical protein